MKYDASTEWTQIGFKNGATIVIGRKCAEVLQQMAASPKCAGSPLHLMTITAKDDSPVLVLLEDIVFVVPIEHEVLVANKATREAAARAQAAFEGRYTKQNPTGLA